MNSGRCTRTVHGTIAVLGAAWCHHRVHRVATADFWRTFRTWKNQPWLVRVGDARPPPFTLIFYHVQSCNIRSSWVGRHTPCISSLPLYALCGCHSYSRSNFELKVQEEIKQSAVYSKRYRKKNLEKIIYNLWITCIPSFLNLLKMDCKVYLLPELIWK